MLVPVLLAYALFPDTTSRIVAQAATEAGPWLTLANLGVGGIFLWAFATGRIVAQVTHKRIQDKLDAAEAELRERNKEAREVLVPTLTRATMLLTRFVDRQDTNTPPPKGRA
jgi:hypothetical protein